MTLPLGFSDKLASTYSADTSECHTNMIHNHQVGTKASVKSGELSLRSSLNICTANARLPSLAGMAIGSISKAPHSTAQTSTLSISQKERTSTSCTADSLQA